MPCSQVPEGLQSVMELWNSVRGKGVREELLCTEHTLLPFPLHSPSRRGSLECWTSCSAEKRGEYMRSLCFLEPESISNSLYEEKNFYSYFLALPDWNTGVSEKMDEYLAIGHTGPQTSIQKGRSEYAASI